jgi:hypothetical protein
MVLVIFVVIEQPQVCIATVTFIVVNYFRLIHLQLINTMDFITEDTIIKATNYSSKHITIDLATITSKY